MDSSQSMDSFQSSIEITSALGTEEPSKRSDAPGNRLRIRLANIYSSNVFKSMHFKL